MAAIESALTTVMSFPSSSLRRGPVAVVTICCSRVIPSFIAKSTRTVFASATTTCSSSEA